MDPHQVEIANETETEHESEIEAEAETANETKTEEESKIETEVEVGTETETEEVKVGSIPKRWRELSGGTNWKNMLNPPDKDLRRYIIHNGEMAMATYDAFNTEQVSQYTGTCRYSKKEFFSKVGLVKGNPFKYTVTKYIYATSNMAVSPSFILKSRCKDSFLKQSNWMGYVAVATVAGKKALGRRDILVAWRGTIRAAEWMEDFDAPLISAGKMFKGYPGVLVHRGFLSVYTSKNNDSKVAKSSARDQALTEIRRLVKKYRHEETSITVAGHSLGAALGTLNAADIVANRVHMLEEEDGTNTWIPVSGFVFACPQTGNRSFRQMVEKLDLLHIMRIRNIRDVVPAVPPEGIYVGVGEQLNMDYMESPYLRPPGDIGSWHDLEVYMHLVAGTQGLVRQFKMVVKRDIALVNKYTNALWDRYLVPPYWKVTANKGMVQQSDGSWKLGYRPFYLEEGVEDEEELEDEDEVEDESDQVQGHKFHVAFISFH
ncbi:hypothetical protein V2J09_002707 [Rumex salicifolius]